MQPSLLLRLTASTGSGSRVGPILGLASLLISIVPGTAETPPRPEGAVFTWGLDSDQTTVPAAAQSGVVAIAAGGWTYIPNLGFPVPAFYTAHTVALKADGSVLAWGDNRLGQTTVPVAARSGVAAIAAAGAHTVALTDAGSVLAWGNNDSGQTTVPVAAESGVVAIAAGTLHTVALKADGSVLAWGDNSFGQTTVPAAARSGVVRIAAGERHTVALKADGSVFAWGDNNSGQTTVPAAAQSGVMAIAVGGWHTVALKADGSVLAWGWNGYGQTTLPAAAQSGVVQIAAGMYHTVALKADRAVLAWGWNGYGQTTLPVAARSGVAAIAAGPYHTVALKPAPPALPHLTLAPGAAPYAPGPEPPIPVNESYLLLTATRDLNQDGRPDFVGVGDSSSIHRFLGRENGAFEALDPLPPLPEGVNPRALSVEDINGDGKPDLLLIGGDRLMVFLGDGQGGFSARAPVYLEVNAWSMRVADVNADGKPDLICAEGRAIFDTHTPHMMVLFGKGQGDFQAGPVTPLVAASTTLAAVSDLNRDGHLDVLIHATQQILGTDQLVGFLGDGQGGFRQSTVNIADAPGYVFAAADLNRDGNMDIVGPQSGGGGLLVLLGDGNAGFIRRSPGAEIVVWPEHISIGDLDGDGEPDLVTAQPLNRTITTWLGNGAGDFTQHATIPLDAEPLRVELADTNGDSILDILCATRTPAGVRIFHAVGPKLSLSLLMVGVPAERYAIEWTHDLSAPDWKPIATLTAPPDGHFETTDQSSGSRRFYRVAPAAKEAQR